MVAVLQCSPCLVQLVRDVVSAWSRDGSPMLTTSGCMLRDAVMVTDDIQSGHDIVNPCIVVHCS